MAYAHSCPVVSGRSVYKLGIGSCRSFARLLGLPTGRLCVVTNRSFCPVILRLCSLVGTNKGPGRTTLCLPGSYHLPPDRTPRDEHTRRLYHATNCIKGNILANTLAKQTLGRSIRAVVVIETMERSDIGAVKNFFKVF